MFGLLDVRHTAYSLIIDGPTTANFAGPFFNMVLLVAVVGGLAYLTTRMLGMAKYGRGGRRNLEIVESMGVGPQSFVHVLRAGERYMLVGVTRGQVTMLSELDKDQLKIPEGIALPPVGFDSLLSRFQSKDGKDGKDGKDERDNAQ